jgi:hypothetical protein
MKSSPDQAFFYIEELVMREQMYSGQVQDSDLRDSENANVPGSRRDLGHIWLRRLSKTTGVAALRRGFCD